MPLSRAESPVTIATNVSCEVVVGGVVDFYGVAHFRADYHALSPTNSQRLLRTAPAGYIVAQLCGRLRRDSLFAPSCESLTMDGTQPKLLWPVLTIDPA